MPNDKGPGWERAACGRLSMWVSNLQRRDVFWRSSQSGGRTTFGAKQDVARERMGLETRGAVATQLEAQAGDICAIDPLGHLLCGLFVIECKFWKDMTFQKLVFGSRGEVSGEWEKVQKIARRTNRACMLLAKQNRIGEVCVVDTKGRDILLTGLEEEKDLQLHALFPVRDMWVYQFKDVIIDVSFDKIRAVYETPSAQVVVPPPVPSLEMERVTLLEDDDE